MNESISFVIFGEPVAKARARVPRKGRAFTPTKTKKAECDFRLQAGKYIPYAPKEGPLFLELVFYRGIPKSWSEKKKGLALQGLILPTSVPDLDNIIKLAKDAMTGRFYRDDAQVCKITAAKFYSDFPRTEVKLSEICPGEADCL